MKRRRPRIDREFPPDVRADVCERAGFRCEICHRRPITCFHHRRRKSQGGLGTLENCLGLCDGADSDGVMGCHEFVHANPAESFANGWLLHALPVAGESA